MGKALAQVVLSTVSQSSDPTKQHLYPCYDGHCLPNYSVAINCDLPNLPMETFCDVKLEVYPENDLDDEHDHQDIREGGVDVLRKGPPLM